MQIGDLVGGVIGNKILAILLAIIALIILIPGLLITWLYGYMTAVIYAIFVLIILFALHKMDILDTSKYPWLVLLPFGAFFTGVIVEKGRVFNIALDAFSIKPLTTYTNESQAMLSPAFFLLIIMVLALAVGLIAEKES